MIGNTSFVLTEGFDKNEVCNYMYTSKYFT